jgi:hypothetical protein
VFFQFARRYVDKRDVGGGASEFELKSSRTISSYSDDPDHRPIRPATATATSSPLDPPPSYSIESLGWIGEEEGRDRTGDSADIART